VLRRLEADDDGLTAEQASRRLEEHGPNRLQETRGPSAVTLLVRQVENPLIYALLGSAALALAFGDLADGLVVLAVVVLNGLIGFVQEYRAGRAIAALAQLVADPATVRRDGRWTTLPADAVVPGDLVAVQAGDKVAADLRLLHVEGLRAVEGALTGESLPVEKDTRATGADAELGERRGMLHAGTLVAAGGGHGVVVATGRTTQLGRISALLDSTAQVETPLTRSLAQVTRSLTAAIGAVAVVLLAVALARGYGLSDAVLAAITLAVAAIPEGLPAIVTITLAVGVQRMARRRAVIRQLPAVETLGATTVVATDKTGTLTRNEMTVVALWTPTHRAELTGAGYDPDGRVLLDGQAAELPRDVRELLLAGVLCSDATLEPRGTIGRAVVGDPTEAALLVAAEKAGLDPEGERAAHPRLDALPFSSERQSMDTLHADGRHYVKGAPEVVLARCAPDQRAAAQAEVEALAAAGRRVLAFAGRRAAALEPGAGDMQLLGLQAMIDPPRPEAIEAVAAVRGAGVTVKMITGDHRATAAAIGRELGIGGAALTGTELDDVDDEALPRVARDHGVFARVAPEHKLRLVRALQSEGEVVAMTGDGVNDAPALRRADVGVAMGQTGSAAAKEAADVVLGDDNFATIRAAVEEGRRVYDNISKALAFLLPTNFGEGLIILVAVLAFPLEGGEPLLPMEPVQLLWLNLVAAVALGLPLAFEAMEPGLMRRAPRPRDERLLDAFVLGRVVLVGGLLAAGAIALFLLERELQLDAGVPDDLATARAQTAAVTGAALLQVVYLFCCRSRTAAAWQMGMFTNPALYLGVGALLALQALFVYAPFMHDLFDTADLDLAALGRAALLALLVLPICALDKRRWRRRGASSSSRCA
jgi:magnesium-transporting ATPase (P-type)